MFAHICQLTSKVPPSHQPDFPVRQTLGAGNYVKAGKAIIRLAAVTDGIV